MTKLNYPANLLPLMFQLRIIIFRKMLAVQFNFIPRNICYVEIVIYVVGTIIVVYNMIGRIVMGSRMAKEGHEGR